MLSHPFERSLVGAMKGKRVGSLKKRAQREKRKKKEKTKKKKLEAESSQQNQKGDEKGEPERRAHKGKKEIWEDSNPNRIETWVGTGEKRGV